MSQDHDIGIKDVSDDVWDAVEAVNANNFDDLARTRIFMKFQHYVENGYICMVREESALPIESIAQLPEGSWYAAPRRAYMFDTVDKLFRGLAMMFAECGDDTDVRRANLIKCMHRMQFKLDLDDMEEDINEIMKL